MNESLVKKDQKINNYRTLFIRCDCHSEVLVIDYDGVFKMIELSIFSSLLTFKMSFWQKIRYIYQILKNGRPYTDQIILHKNQIDELKAFLNSI
jgi:hypothetical protein